MNAAVPTRYPEFVDVTLSPLDAASLPRAFELHTALYSHEGLPSRDPAREQAMAELMAHPDLGGTWMILADGVVAGYVVLTVCYSLEFHGRFGLLDELYLDEPWRGKGIARDTLAFIDRECRRRGLQAVRLETAHTNERALSVYQKAGYRVDSRHLLTKWL